MKRYLFFTKSNNSGYSVYIMKHWRKIIIYTLILVMPISMWASVAMASHCQTSNDTSMNGQMDHSQHMQMQDQLNDQDVDNQTDCECGCNCEMNCSVSGCNAAAVTNFVGTPLINSTQLVYTGAATLVFPPDPNLLFRPPIYLS